MPAKQEGEATKGSPTLSLYQPQSCSMNIHTDLECLISNEEGIKVLASVTAFTR